ncbi:MAG TPA: GNAT family N-acetyltransferase [Solirubrobacterales bacterium]|nr:GNAT family N-acetyltransferase [Solirubrobacterales bacterium]
MASRIATPEDLDGICETLASAFADDPLWGWAFPGGEGLEEWWRFFAGSALRYPWSWISGECAAVSVWIPPGGIELTEEEEAAMEPLLRDLIGERAVEVMGLMGAFDERHPSDPPHYYLSLLGVHEAHRGKGLGMALLAENLERIDAETGAPAYLESSNPANDARYSRQGFRPVGELERPDGGAKATTMWRDGRGR